MRDEVGLNIGRGVAGGIEDSRYDVDVAMTTLMRGAVNAGQGAKLAFSPLDVLARPLPLQERGSIGQMGVSETGAMPDKGVARIIELLEAGMADLSDGLDEVKSMQVVCDGAVLGRLMTPYVNQNLGKKARAAERGF
jgi:hypothetical protein